MATAAVGSVAAVACAEPAYFDGSKSSSDGVTVTHWRDAWAHRRSVGRPNTRTSRVSTGDVNAR
jgi:hypothetical protein